MPARAREDVGMASATEGRGGPFLRERTKAAPRLSSGQLFPQRNDARDPGATPAIGAGSLLPSQKRVGAYQSNFTGPTAWRSSASYSLAGLPQAGARPACASVVPGVLAAVLVVAAIAFMVAMAAIAFIAAAIVVFADVVLGVVLLFPGVAFVRVAVLACVHASLIVLDVHFVTFGRAR